MTPSLFGYELDSALALRGVRPGSCPRGRLRIERSQDDLLDQPGELIVWDDAAGPQFAMASVRAGLLVWCSESGSYLIDAPAGLVQTRPHGHPEHWEHRLAATVIPLLLAERGDLALHAATVLDGTRAVAFCGRTGHGKSTLATALALRGHVVASEDGSVISDAGAAPRVWPGPAGVRVTAETLRALGGEPEIREPTGKALRLAAGPQIVSDSPAELNSVVVLRERGGSALHLRRLDPPSAVPALMPSVLYAGPARLLTALRLAALIAERVPIFEARLPDDLAAVGDAASMILRTVSCGG